MLNGKVEHFMLSTEDSKIRKLAVNSLMKLEMYRYMKIIKGCLEAVWVTHVHKSVTSTL